jgi:hypothetical protein
MENVKIMQPVTRFALFIVVLLYCHVLEGRRKGTNGINESKEWGEEW